MRRISSVLNFRDCITEDFHGFYFAVVGRIQARELYPCFSCLLCIVDASRKRGTSLRSRNLHLIEIQDEHKYSNLGSMFIGASLSEPHTCESAACPPTLPVWIYIYNMYIYMYVFYI